MTGLYRWLLTERFQRLRSRLEDQRKAKVEKMVPKLSSFRDAALCLLRCDLSLPGLPFCPQSSHLGGGRLCQEGCCSRRPCCCILVQHVAVSSGSGQNDLEKMSSILEAVPQVKFICLDVANGYSEHFVEFVKLVRGRFPQHTIMVSTGGIFSR